MDESKTRRPVWPWIVAVVIGMPALYVLSLPPLQLAYEREWLPQNTVRREAADVYAYPAIRIMKASPPRVQNAIDCTPTCSPVDDPRRGTFTAGQPDRVPA